MEHEKPLIVAPVSKPLAVAILASLLGVAAGFPLIQAVYEAVALRETPYVAEFFRRVPTKDNLHAWDQAARDRSIFGKAVRPFMLQTRHELLGELGPKALQGRDSWLFYRPDADYLLWASPWEPRFYKDSYDTLVNGAWVNPRDPLVAIRDFRDRLAARGTALLLAPIPGKPSVYPERLGRFAAQPPWATRRFLDSLRAGGFFVVDVHAALMRAKSRGEAPLYLEHDTHWTPRGMEAAAAEIAAALKAHPEWIDAADTLRRVYAVKEEPVDRFGDIAEMTKLPRRHEIFPPQRVDARQVVDPRSGAVYRDDPGSPVLWLGDSFSRIYQTDAPRGAGVIAHVALELGFPLASIVNDGGASTVVRQQLARRPEALSGKKVVVWAFVERDLRFGDKGWMLLGPLD